MIQLGGKPMMHHVIERLRPQADPILVSIQGEDSSIETLGLDTIVDAVQRHRGPLTGLYSALHHVCRHSDQEWLLLCPCDAPFIPEDLAGRLFEDAVKFDKPVSVACYEEVPQPTFSLWHRSVLTRVKEAVMSEGKGGLMYMLDQLPYCVVDWTPNRIAPFFNVNTRADLQMAERLLDRSLDAG